MRKLNKKAEEGGVNWVLVSIIGALIIFAVLLIVLKTLNISILGLLKNILGISFHIG